MSEREKTAAELWQQVTERLTRQSVTEIVDGKPEVTFYYPMPDGSVRFSYYGRILHANGVVTGREAEELRAKHPEWFPPEQP